MTTEALTQKLIRAVDEADSAKKLLQAVQDLAAAGLVETTPNLIAALNYNNPGAAVAAVDGLVKIGEPAVKPLLELIDNYNYGARAWAIRALAGIGDPRALNILLDTAQNDFALSVRRAAARGLGCIRWQELPADEVKHAQMQALAALLKVTEDPEWVVRYSAVMALDALAMAVATTQPELLAQITLRFEQILEIDTDLTVRSRVKMAQQQLTVCNYQLTIS